MFETSRLFKAAHHIRAHLTELVGSEEAQTIDARLGELLTKTEPNEEVEQQIFTLLQSNEKIAEWVGKFYAEEFSEEKRFAGLPGENTTWVPADQYHCSAPGCPHTWCRRTLGEPIPQCPEHHLPLIPKE